MLPILLTIMAIVVISFPGNSCCRHEANLYDVIAFSKSKLQTAFVRAVHTFSDNACAHYNLLIHQISPSSILTHRSS